MMHMPVALSGLPRVIPLVVIQDESDIGPLTRCFVEAQLTTIEVAMRSENATTAISSFREAGVSHVGAGTVDSVHKLDQAIRAGASFGLAPSLSLAVLDEATDRNWPFIAGAATPSEVAVLVDHGCDLVKIFPAHYLGGVGYIQALSDVFPRTEFIPTGGITSSDVEHYLAVKSVRAVGGSWPIPKDLVREKKWDEITKRIVATRVEDER